jgi:uncharacterized protein DUF4258
MAWRMNINRIRRLVIQERVTLRFTDHAIIEARKDGLTVEDLEDNSINGELVEDYGIRALFLNFIKDDELPCHVVLEYVPGSEEVVCVTAYVPNAEEWEPNWKKRKRKKRR